MELTEILSFKRPTLMQESWLPEVISWLPEDIEVHKSNDGEIMAISMEMGPSPATLYSCHLDTVHHKLGRQVLMRGERAGTLQGFDTECLGADDGAGIWLLLQMIEAKVPGGYVFHLGEEDGCIGSRWMARERKDWLQSFERCISFDRPGTSDVVTHFRGKRGCSPGFALTLALELTMRMPGYFLSPCSGGGATDVMHYIGIIDECTNISIGYHRQHTPAESLDVNYLEALRDAILDYGTEVQLARCSGDIQCPSRASGYLPTFESMDCLWNAAP